MNAVVLGNGHDTACIGVVGLVGPTIANRPSAIRIVNCQVLFYHNHQVKRMANLRSYRYAPWFLLVGEYVATCLGNYWRHNLFTTSYLTSHEPRRRWTLNLTLEVAKPYILKVTISRSKICIAKLSKNDVIKPEKNYPGMNVKTMLIARQFCFNLITWPL